MGNFILFFDKFLDFIKVPIKKWQSLSSNKYNNDKKIFIESNEILNEEQMLYLLECAYGLRFNHKQSEKQQEYVYYFLMSENIDNKIISKIFNDKKLQNLHLKFLTQFVEIFKNIEWCTNDANNNIIELNRNLKKFDNLKYKEETNKIKKLSNEAMKSYQEYRRKIKKKFGI